MKKLLSFILAVCLMLSLCSAGFALQDTKEIEITYREISITLDGTEIIPVDAAGYAVEPFIYNGTTYLPIRGIANALKLAVDWNGDTSTVTLTSGGTAVPPLEPAKASQGTETKSAAYRNISIVINGEKISPKDVAGNTVEPFIIDGTTYLPVRAISEALALYVQWDGNTNTVILSTKAPVEPGDNEGQADNKPADTEPNDTPIKTSGTYVGSINSDKYHYPSCRYANKIEPESRIWFDSESEAIAAGYSPCGVCKP